MMVRWCRKGKKRHERKFFFADISHTIYYLAHSKARDVPFMDVWVDLISSQLRFKLNEKCVFVLFYWCDRICIPRTKACFSHIYFLHKKKIFCSCHKFVCPYRREDRIVYRLLLHSGNFWNTPLDILLNNMHLQQRAYISHAHLSLLSRFNVLYGMCRKQHLAFHFHRTTIFSSFYNFIDFHPTSIQLLLEK